MAVIIKDFQVVTEPPPTPSSAPSASTAAQQREPMPPAPKQVAQTLRYLQQRSARVHAD